jgi:hypothetical protein
MEPLLIGGFLIILVGSVMLTVGGLKPGWWHALLLQSLGIAMMAAFFLQAGEFGMAPVQEAFAKIGGQVANDLKPKNTTTTLQEEKVVSTTSDAPVDAGSVVGDAAAVTVTAAVEKEHKASTFYKCTDQNGKETLSAEPCK